MTDAARAMRVGVISDTHGTLSEATERALRGVDAIIHAGDVGSESVYYDLMAIAPVTAVLGNTDPYDFLGGTLDGLVNVKLGGARVLVVHEPAHQPYPLPDDVNVVIVGHTHKPKIEERDGVLYLDPGSASRSRGAGHTIAILTIEADGATSAQIITL